MEIKDYYTFYREDGQDNSIHYIFTTDRQLIYSVFFHPPDFSDYLSDLPHLSEVGHLFGFFPISGEEQELSAKQEKKYDVQIANTICRIVQDFFEIKGKDCVLLFHCDNDDERQGFRYRLFEMWYKRRSDKFGIYKDGIEVQIEKKDGTKSFEYLGFIVDSQRTDKVNIIKSEFEEIAVSLIHQKR